MFIPNCVTVSILYHLGHVYIYYLIYNFVKVISCMSYVMFIPNISLCQVYNMHESYLYQMCHCVKFIPCTGWFLDANKGFVFATVRAEVISWMRMLKYTLQASCSLDNVTVNLADGSSLDSRNRNPCSWTNLYKHNMPNNKNVKYVHHSHQ